ncbi:NAD(P)-binding domain-containing protein [Rhizobium sp. S-51]|uniref:NAD(P)-binding domain-containing protein n=1 Tax=Rhizobium terricola TaxID=2728849 RepID=A0A7Y0ASI6_9HYPH|nr:NAD(P)-binding domain-containing protein [Rhizobium terricola]NML72696.1 NAD(P)-binding domain-containing protein [Rhizobium terricola]
MKVSIIGTGNMGSGFANQLVKAGHSVTVSGRDAAKAAALAAASGAGIGNAASAAVADVIILATGFDTAADALKSLGDLSGKIVVDVTNPLTADYMGLTIGHSTSAAEQIAAAVPGVTLVKGFNTLFAPLLAAGPRLGDDKVPVFLASDDAAAKQIVGDLARSIGFAVVDAGPLKNARYLEPLAGLNIYLGYGAGLGTAIAPAWLPFSA